MKNHNIIFIALISFLLLIIIFKWIDYLVINDYVRLNIEGFDNTNTNTSSTSSSSTNHNVDMPLTTTYSCKNMCGPPNRCSITGQQCFADIDCPGCEPYSPPLKSADKESEKIVGQNDAGKLTVGTTPTYSELTTDIGTQARIVNFNKLSKPVMPNFGVNTWETKFNQSRKLFDDRYKPVGLKSMPSYPDRYSLTGEFVDEGPLPSNSYLQ